MPLRPAESREGLTSYETWRTRRDAEDEAPLTLTEEEASELRILQYCRRLLDAGVAARKPHDTFDEAFALYIGDMWSGTSQWKARITINKVRAYIHFMQAVMVDNKPRFNVEPLVPGTENAARLLGKLADRDWDNNDCQDKLALATLYGLIWGTGILKRGYNPHGNGGTGKHEVSAVVPYRVWVNAGATGVDDAEFLIHIERRTLGWVFRNFPEKARAIRLMRGSDKIGTSPGLDSRDFLREGQNPPGGPDGVVSPETLNGKAVTMPARAPHFMDEDLEDEVEVMECWFRDETLEPYKRQAKNPDGSFKTEDVLDDNGLPVMEFAGAGIQVSPIDGMPFLMPYLRVKQKPVMEDAKRPRFPNGRVAIICGPVLCRDIANPFRIDGFPFAEWKDQNVGTFFGQGEPLGLKSMNIGINRMVSALYDNLNLTGNPSWVVDKAAGLNYRTLKNKPGSVIPMDDINGIKPLETKQLPAQFIELPAMLKASMSEVSGISDSAMGAAPPANTAFATIDSLHESSAAVMRQKVRNMERMIKRFGKLTIQMIQQFDNGELPLRSNYDNAAEKPYTPLYGPPDENGEQGELIGVVPPAADVEVKFDKYTNDDLQGPVEFSVVADSSLTTSPAGMWNRYMQLWDKKLIDLRGFHEKFEIDNWRQIVKRMEAMQAMASAGKGGGARKQQGSRRGPQPHPPQSNVPSREANSSVR